MKRFASLFVLDIFQILFTSESILDLVTSECKSVLVDLLQVSLLSSAPMLRAIAFKTAYNVFSFHPKVGREVLSILQQQMHMVGNPKTFWEFVIEECGSDYLHSKISSLMLINVFLKVSKKLWFFLLYSLCWNFPSFLDVCQH